MRIVIMPSSQEHNACKMGDTEQAHTRLIAKRAAELVRAAGHDARYVVAGDDRLSDSEQLAQMAAASNALNPDLHVDVHTDAGGATGSTVFYIGQGRSKQLGEAVYAELAKAVPFPHHGCRERGTLYMLRKTTASAILVECWPHDRDAQARWGHDNIEAVAAAIARGVLKIAGGTLGTTVPEEDDMALTADDIYQITARAVREAATPADGWPGATLSQVVSDLHAKIGKLEGVIIGKGLYQSGMAEEVRTDIATEAGWQHKQYLNLQADIARLDQRLEAVLAVLEQQGVQQ